MLFVVRQPDGYEIGVHADRLTIEATGGGKYNFQGPDGAFLELPARKVIHVRLVDETWPDRMTDHEESAEPVSRPRAT